MRRCTLAAVLVLALLPCVATPAAAQQPVRSAPGGVLLNFQDADIAYVMTTLAQAANIGLVYTDLPQKPVTLRTPQPVTAEQMISLIRSLAAAHNISVVQEGNIIRLQGAVQQAGEDPRQLYIYRLKHARAPFLGATLQALFGGGGAIRPGTTVGGNTLSAQLQQMQTQAQAAAARPPTVQQQQQPVVVVGGGGQISVTMPVVIVPDEVTNSLLIRATPTDWQVMQQAIAALDLRPLQVVIEVVIAEVRRNDDVNIGTSIRATDTRPRPGESTVGTLPSGAREGDFSLRLIRRGEIDVEATLSALAASGRVRILSRPVIQAQNNQPARIAVGEERPFVQSSRSLPTGEPIRDEVIQYRDVVTSLDITPTINEDGYVNLSIVQEVNHATNEIQFGAPVISTRNATTQILARDGQTVVIGGLIDRQTDRTRSGIPYLKDIPLLGFLFGTTRETTGNSELFLFLTPHIVATDEDADRMKDEIERAVELLAPLTPIRPLIPPAGGIPLPIRPDTLPIRPVRPDTLRMQERVR